MTDLTPTFTTTEDAIKQELQRFDSYDARKSELQALYGPIKVQGVEDSQGIQEAKTARKELRSMRLKIEEERKNAKELYLRIGQAIDHKAKELTEFVRSLEEPIDHQIKAIDEEKERLKKEAERTKNKRLSELSKFGAVVIDDNIVLEDVSFTTAILGQMSEWDYQANVVPLFAEIHERNEAVKLEQERKLQAEREELERQKRELEQQRLEMERLEMERKKAQEQERQAIINARIDTLKSYGMVYDSKAAYYWYEAAVGLSAFDVEYLSDAKWGELLPKIAAEIANFRRDKEERIRKELEERDERIRQQAILDQQEAARLAELKYQEEMLASNDTDKWNYFYEQFEALVVPDMRSGQYRKRMSLVREHLEAIKELKNQK